MLLDPVQYVTPCERAAAAADDKVDSSCVNALLLSLLLMLLLILLEGQGSYVVSFPFPFFVRVD